MKVQRWTGAVSAHLAAAKAERDALANAEWLTTAHMICTDAGIEQGHIAERMKQLRDKWDALRRDAERLAYLFQFATGDVPEDRLEPFAESLNKSKNLDEFRAAIDAATESDTKGETKW
jgi:hypothetical protein